MHLGDQMTTIDFPVLPVSLHAAKWKQFTLSKNAIYETVKHYYMCQPLTSLAPFYSEETRST